MSEIVCWVCSSNKFVDEHHYDCLEGKLSPETVPLCRRCHRTYHGLGANFFEDEYLDKVIEIENKRREIWKANNHGRAQLPMTREDIRRSDYWNKKHNIAPPTRPEKRKAELSKAVRVGSIPLCGWEWLETHRRDHTQEEADALAIEITYDGKQLPLVSVGDKRGAVKAIIRNVGNT